MKHLKRFIPDSQFHNESFVSDIDYAIQDIKDVFQDLIDDWDLELIGPSQVLPHGGKYIRIFSSTASKSDDEKGVIIINIFKKEYGEIGYANNSPEFKNDIVDHVERLKRMGFYVRFEKEFHYDHISVHLKKESPKFESLNKYQFHIDQIKDIFQDVIDEYSIDAQTDLSRQFISDPGLYYAIINKGKLMKFVIAVNFFHDIYNVFSNESSDQDVSLYKKFTSLREDLKLVNKRLKTVGYKFKKMIIGSGIFYSINPFFNYHQQFKSKPLYFTITFWSEHGVTFQQSDAIENLDLGPYIKRLEFAGYTIENRTLIWDKDSDKSRCGQLSNKLPKWGDIKQIILDIYPS